MATVAQVAKRYSTFNNEGRAELRLDSPVPLEFQDGLSPTEIHHTMLRLVGQYEAADYAEKVLVDQEISRLDSAVHSLEVECARHDINAFVEYAFTDKNGNPLKQAAIHREWHEAIDLYDRVCIVAPRDHGKTVQIAVARCLWELGREPNLRIKIVCQSDEKAKERLASIKEHLERNPKVQEVFPNLRPAEKGSWTKHKIYVERDAFHVDASIEAKGVLSSASGGRADLIIGDDTCDRRNSLGFPKLRTQVKQAWKDDWTNLLEEEGGRIVYICTLWHTDDLSHRILENAEYFVVFHAIDEKMTPVWPEVWTTPRLQRRRREIGRLSFDRGFRQIALSGEVVCVDQDWIEYKSAPRGDGDNLLRIDGYDPAIGKKAANHYFGHVGIVIDMDEGYVYVEVARQGRYSFKQQTQLLLDNTAARRSFRVVLEATAAQDWLAQHALDLAPIPIETVKPSVDKMLRLQRVTPLLENGRVFFDPSMEPMKIEDPEEGDLVSQLLNFPLSAHDDLVDAFVYACTAAQDMLLDRVVEEHELDCNVIAIG